MSKPFKLFAALSALVLALFAGSAAYFYYNPVGIGIVLARQGLSRGGLTPFRVEGPRGELVYWRGGNGETVVLVHGLGNQAGSWVKLAPDLVQEYRVLVPDLTGHGESQPFEGALSFDDLVDGLAAVLDQRGVPERVTLIGNSLGGWVSLAYAERFPQRVEHLVLLNSAGLESDLDEWPLVPETIAEARRLVDGMSPPGTPPVADFVLDDLVEKIAEGPSPRLLPSLTESDLMEGRLGTLEPPTDVIWGLDDQLLDTDYLERLMAQLPNARRHDLPGCGHLPQQQCPGELLGLLFELLPGPRPEEYEAAKTTEPALQTEPAPAVADDEPVQP